MLQPFRKYILPPSLNITYTQKLSFYGRIMLLAVTTCLMLLSKKDISDVKATLA